MTPPDRAPEPLSAEDERTLRRLAAVLRPDDNAFSDTTVLRLLATLDAARDSRPVGEGLDEPWGGITSETIVIDRDALRSEIVAEFVAPSGTLGKYLTAEQLRAYSDELQRLRDAGPLTRAPEQPSENAELLRRLDAWIADLPAYRSSAAPLIGWAAAHLRGCTALATDQPASTEAGEGGVCPHGVYLDTRCFNCSPGAPGGAIAVGSLDAAWAEAEAALPDGWHIANLVTDGPRNPGWWVQARSQMLRSETDVNATGPTPAAALRALAAALRDPS